MRHKKRNFLRNNVEFSWSAALKLHSQITDLKRGKPWGHLFLFFSKWVPHVLNHHSAKSEQLFRNLQMKPAKIYDNNTTVTSHSFLVLVTSDTSTTPGSPSFIPSVENLKQNSTFYPNYCTSYIKQTNTYKYWDLLFIRLSCEKKKKHQVPSNQQHTLMVSIPFIPFNTKLPKD